MAFNQNTVITKSYTCAFWAESGRCKRGDQCKYTHGPARLRVAEKPGWDAKAGRSVAGNNARHLKVAFQQPQNALPSGNKKRSGSCQSGVVPVAPAVVAAEPPRRLSADAAEFVPGADAAAAPAAVAAPVVYGRRGEPQYIDRPLVPRREPQGLFPHSAPPPKTLKELVEGSEPLSPLPLGAPVLDPIGTWRPGPEDDPFASWNGYPFLRSGVVEWW